MCLVDKIRLCAKVCVLAQERSNGCRAFPSHHLPSQFIVPELIEALLDDVNALPQLCLSDDERWSKPYLVPMGWLTQETILCELQAEVPSTVACGGTQERST